MIVLVAISVISWLFTRDAINFHRADDNMKAVISKLAYVLESEFSEGRKRRMVQRLLRNFAPPPKKPGLERPGFQPFYLVDDNNRLKSGELPPDAVIALQRRTQTTAVAIHKDFVFVGPKPVTIDGKSYHLFVTQFIGRFKGRLIFHFVKSFSVWQLAAYFVVSGLMCFVLAWSLTRPIRQLQSAARKVANGESTSVVPSMGKRRDEFYWLAKDFDHMAQKILNTVDTQKQLLSDVSHELRSPLSRMQIALGLLEKRLGDKGGEHVKRLEKECNRMDEMIGQLLSIAALQRGQGYEKEQLIELDKLLNDIVRDAAFEAKQKSLHFECELASGLTCKGYYHLLYSAVENVVRNAIRYTYKGTKIHLRLFCENSTAIIDVFDQGPGVAAEHLGKLFEPFYRTDDARSREQGGAGLGLAISAKAIMAHGGSIHAEPAHLDEDSSGRMATKQTTGLRVIIRLPLDINN